MPLSSGTMASIQTPSPGCGSSTIESSTRSIRSTESPRSKAATPPHEVVANNCGTPSTISHVIGTFESTAPGMLRREVRTRRADGVPRSCAGAGTSTVATPTAISAARARRRANKTGGADLRAARKGDGAVAPPVIWTLVTL